MGRSSFSSSRSSINGNLNIEGLPLYSDLTITPPADLTAPSEKATPDEVRSFLVQLLVQNRGLHHDHARRIASKWNLGTGRELISYTPTLYAEIFGLEDAWMVYKEAKLFILTQRKKGKPSGIWVAIGILSVLTTVAVTLCIVSSLEDHPAAKIGFGFAGFFLGCSWLGCLLNAVFDATDETRIENELAAGLKKV